MGEASASSGPLQTGDDDDENYCYKFLPINNVNATRTEVNGNQRGAPIKEYP